MFDAMDDSPKRMAPHRHAGQRAFPVSLPSSGWDSLVAILEMAALSERLALLRAPGSSSRAANAETAALSAQLAQLEGRSGFTVPFLELVRAAWVIQGYVRRRAHRLAHPNASWRWPTLEQLKLLGAVEKVCRSKAHQSNPAAGQCRAIASAVLPLCTQQAKPLLVCGRASACLLLYSLAGAPSSAPPPSPRVRRYSAGWRTRGFSRSLRRSVPSGHRSSRSRSCTWTRTRSPQVSSE